MTPAEYESFRNELIGILQEALSLDSVSKKTGKTLSQICRKTQENQFEIVLVGEFQGGKSTTFNALCDGRELSPRGSGIKTSGCIVAAQNLSDADEPEKAVVEWRNSQELISGFSDLLLPHLQTIVSWRFNSISAAALSQEMNLEDENDRLILMDAVNKEWEVWEKDKANYDREQRGKLDILCLASLAAHHYANDKLKKLRLKTEFKPGDIGGMIVFPNDWGERWIEKDPARFQIEEVLFAFIKSVRLKIHSENLGRLGCVIVDCPGLFASRWDTGVARKAMFDADAILYLFDGSKTMKLSDLKELRFVRRNRMEHKLFYACNMLGKTVEESKRIMAATVSMLANNGFSVSEDDVTLYHALLALRSVQAEKFMEGRLDNFTNGILTDNSRVNPEDIARKKLLKEIMRQMMILDLDDDMVMGLNPATIMRVREASGINRLMDMVEKTVIRKKARTVLIDNGSQKGVNSLLEAEAALQIREANAFETEKDFWKQAEEAESAMQNFDKTCKRIVAQLDDDSPDRELARDGWAFIIKEKEELGEYIAQRLFEEIVTIGIWGSVFHRKQMEDKIDSIVTEAIDAYFETYITAWISSIKEGDNEMYNRRMTKRIRAVDRDVRNKWLEVIPSDLSILSGITIPNYSGNLSIDSETFIQQLEKEQLVGSNALTFFIKAGGFLGFVALGAMITISVFAVSNPFIAMIAIVVLSSFGGSVTTVMIEKVKQGVMLKKIKKKIPAILDELFKEVEGQIKEHLKNFITEIRGLYKKGFTAAISIPRTIFEERKEQARADFAKSLKNRESLAEDAKNIRENKIKPLRMGLQEFVSRVDECLKESEQ